MPRKKQSARGRSRLNGEGTISGPRKDGRYVGAFYAPTTAGTRKRVYVYGRTREEARDKLIEEQAKAARGIPVAAHSWQLRAYLDYWLEHVMKPTRRPATYALYEMTVRLHLTPALGKYPLKRLSVPIVQTFLNGQLRDGQSVRYVHVMRQVLSAALSRAVREELIARNVARLVELPPWEPAEVEPWSSAEALAFLTAAADDPLYPAFVLLLLYGMRRGEVLGLRWQDIDLGRSILHIRQQIQRVQGELRIGPVKTRAGSRDLPYSVSPASPWPPAAITRKQTDPTLAGPGPIPGSSSPPALADRSSRVTSSGPSPASATTTPSARSVCMPCGTPPRPCSRTSASRPGTRRSILGHAHIATTQQIYTHVDEAARLDAITKLNKLLGGTE